MDIEAEVAQTQSWGLSGLRRRDIQQADLAPLIASLLLTTFPRNSVGVLPLSYIIPGEQRAYAIGLNAAQMYSQFAKKEDVSICYSTSGIDVKIFDGS